MAAVAIAPRPPPGRRETRETRAFPPPPCPSSGGALRSFFSPPRPCGGRAAPGAPPAAPRSAGGPQAELVGTPAPTPPDWVARALLGIDLLVFDAATSLVQPDDPDDD